MARSDVDKRVEQALKALIAPREDSVRELARALDAIASTDAKIDALLAELDKLVSKAGDAFDAAKKAGWKNKELVGAGLTVPRSYALPTKKTVNTAQASQTPAEPAIAG
jgi:hypothetical protein